MNDAGELPLNDDYQPPMANGEVLFDELSLPGGKKGKSGNYSVNAETLNNLARAGHEIVTDTITWRLLNSVKSKLSGLVNEGTDIARISRELVLLKDDVPVDRPLDSFAVQEQEPETLLPFLREQGFKSIVARLESRMADAGNGIADAAPTEVSYELVQDEDALARWGAEATRQGVVAVERLHRAEVRVAHADDDDGEGQRRGVDDL